MFFVRWFSHEEILFNCASIGKDMQSEVILNNIHWIVAKHCIWGHSAKGIKFFRSDRILAEMPEL